MDSVLEIIGANIYGFAFGVGVGLMVAGVTMERKIRRIAQNQEDWVRRYF